VVLQKLHREVAGLPFVGHDALPKLPAPGDRIFKRRELADPKLEAEMLVRLGESGSEKLPIAEGGSLGAQVEIRCDLRASFNVVSVVSHGKPFLSS
jgi:hypothetical protein